VEPNFKRSVRGFLVGEENVRRGCSGSAGGIVGGLETFLTAFQRVADGPGIEGSAFRCAVGELKMSNCTTVC
jgi:hypothetical protein